LRNVQAVQPSLIDDGGLVSREGRGDVVRGWHRVTEWRIRRWKPRGDRSGARHAVGCSRHQGSAVRRQAHGGMPALHPRRGSIGRAPLGFLMGESGQPSQMAPVGAGRVALVPAGQLSSDCGCQLRWQRLRTHPNPNLQVAGAGLDHGARCMAVGAMTSRTVGAARSRSPECSRRCGSTHKAGNRCQIPRGCGRAGILRWTPPGFAKRSKGVRLDTVFGCGGESSGPDNARRA
jgi:hypothetical protein